MEQLIFKDGFSLVDERLINIMSVIMENKPEITDEEYSPFERDERGIAELFAQCYINEVRFCYEHKSWYVYAEGKWCRDDTSLLTMGKMTEFTRLLEAYALHTIEDKETKSNYLKFLSKCGDRRFRDRALKDAANHELLLISASKFDANPYLINCKNGTYDLSTDKFYTANPDDLLTMQTNFNYIAWQPKKCERWIKFIDDIMQGDEVKKKYLQKCAGYSIYGMASEEMMVILYGRTTRNGKSTFLNAIEYMLGSYSTVSPVSIICKSQVGKNAEGASPMIASLKGKRFVTMAESNQYGKLDEEQIKQLTGGEEIKARNLYEKPITFLPQFTLFLSCNDLPMVQDKSVFASQRIRVISFEKHFTQAEQDKNLKKYFATEDAMQGIFQWLLDGYKMYVAEGLEMPDEIRKVVNQYARDNDLVLQFLEDNIEKSETKGIKAKMLYELYQKWCRKNNNYVCTSRKFYSELDSHPEWYIRKRITGGYTVYDGMDLKVGE